MEQLIRSVFSPPKEMAYKRVKRVGQIGQPPAPRLLTNYFLEITDMGTRFWPSDSVYLKPIGEKFGNPYILQFRRSRLRTKTAFLTILHRQ